MAVVAAQPESTRRDESTASVRLDAAIMLQTMTTQLMVLPANADELRRCVCYLTARKQPTPVFSFRRHEFVTGPEKDKGPAISR